MKKLLLNKFRIMKLNNLSKIKGGDPTNNGETGKTGETNYVCVSTSLFDVPKEVQMADYPTTVGTHC